MFNLQIIKGLKSLGGDYLGISSGFLVEVRDNDPGISLLLPEGVHFTPSFIPAYRGRRRLTLLNYGGNCLVMIKSSRSKGGAAQAQLYIYVNKGIESNRDVLAITRILASYRWPLGILYIKKPSLRQMHTTLPEDLRDMGWRDLRAEKGDRAFELSLPNIRSC